MNACIPAMNTSTRIPATSRRKGAARTRLAYGQIFSRQLQDAEALRFRIVSGHLWITMEGSREDHLLAAGDSITMAGPGRLVAEGIEDGAVVEIG
jgi:hypothetical protein